MRAESLHDPLRVRVRIATGEPDHLRARFPVAVRNEFATCEIQFGFVRRPTHGNTSWDWAKDEIPAQRWIW